MTICKHNRRRSSSLPSLIILVSLHIYCYRHCLCCQQCFSATTVTLDVGGLHFVIKTLSKSVSLCITTTQIWYLIYTIRYCLSSLTIRLLLSAYRSNIDQASPHWRDLFSKMTGWSCLWSRIRTTFFGFDETIRARHSGFLHMAHSSIITYIPSHRIIVVQWQIIRNEGAKSRLSEARIGSVVVVRWNMTV